MLTLINIAFPASEQPVNRRSEFAWPSGWPEKPAADLIDQGIQNGLIVARDQNVYDGVTGRQVGRNMQIRQEAIRPLGSGIICHCSLIAGDGESYRFTVYDTVIQCLNSDFYTGSNYSCHDPRPWSEYGERDVPDAVVQDRRYM
jgi:hypothetical protein